MNRSKSIHPREQVFLVTTTLERGTKGENVYVCVFVWKERKGEGEK